MSNNEQNGRQPPLLPQTTPPTDPRQDGVCRDFVWGVCKKGVQCKYPHALHFECMKKILKFCHDFQNRSGCNRPDCKFLHTSNKEEELFWRTGQLPRVLRERYAAMTRSTTSTSMYMDQILMQPPPPPPPPPPPEGTLPAAATSPPPIPAPLPTLLAPPPPPPPPTVATTPVQITPPIFAAPPPVNSLATFTSNQPSLPMQFRFDPSKPPPPLTAASIAPKNGALKRPAEPIEAGPSKARKQEGSKVENGLCESCAQRKLRVEVLHKEMQTLECERKCQTYLFEKKTEAYDNGKLLLKSAVSAELYRILDEYIESPSQTAQTPEATSQYNQMSSLVTGSTPLQKQVMLNMMELAKNIVETSPRTNSFGTDSEWTIQNIIELLQNVNDNPQKSTPVVNGFGSKNGNVNCSSPVASATPHLENLIHASQGLTQGHSQAQKGVNSHNKTHSLNATTHLQNVTHTQSTANIQNSTHSQSTIHIQNASQQQSMAHIQHATHSQNAVHQKNVIQTQTQSANPQNHSQGATHPQNGTQPQNVAHLQGVAHSSNAIPAIVQPMAYAPYQTAVPPPSRTGYPQYPSTPNSVPNTPYSPVRANSTPAAARPSTSASTPTNTYTYGIARYPYQNYYPPFQ